MYLGVIVLHNKIQYASLKRGYSQVGGPRQILVLLFFMIIKTTSSHNIQRFLTLAPSFRDEYYKFQREALLLLYMYDFAK